MKELARRYVWLAGIDKYIQELMLSCAPCLKHAKNPKKEIVQSWKPAGKPFERLHGDYARAIEGKYILLIVDAFSK